VDQRLQRVRLVTERYSELKGLHAAYAGALWVCFGTALYLRQEVDAMILLAAFGGAVVAYLPGKWWLDRYYRTRFGQIVVSPLRASRLLLIPVLLAISLTDDVLGGGPLGGAFLVVAAGSLWTAIRDWPARGHHLIGCVAGALAAALQFPSESTAFAKPQALGVAIIGLSYIPIGLLDHRLLTSVLRRPAAEPGLTCSEERTAKSK
jgi:hypothetical protein